MSEERPKTLVISPHLDDAALSASHKLRAGAVVVTVFAGVPASDAPLGWWDRLTGASSARGRQQERIAEDAAAMRFAHAAAVRLEHLDGQYRDGAPADAGAIAGDLASLVAVAEEVWLPAGIGHPDHLAVREAGLAVAQRRGQSSAFLYADIPHAIPYGWPAWVTGREPRPHLDVDAWMADQLRGTGLDTERLRPVTVHLDEPVRSFKRALLAHYPTQLAAVGMDEQSLQANPELLAYEVAWECPL